MSDTQALELMRRVRPARAACASGSGTVLDELLKHSGATLMGIDTMLRQAAGIAAVDSGPGVVIDPHALSPAQLKAFGCVALRCRDETEVRLGFADPWDDQRVQQAAAALGRWPLLAAVSSALLGQPNAGSLDAGSLRDGAQPADPVAVAVIDFVDGALSRACDIGASDVHFECDRTGVTVKHRLDGVMVRYARLDGLAKSEQVVSRIKVLAQLDITERRTPQDGRFRWQQAQRSVDLRVSIMPSIHGEDAVLRLLDRAQLRASTDTASLDGLGFNPDDAERLRALAQLPHGMLLVTGPTGSGKTTTVYAALCEINSGREKIITIEDPVEYELSGVLQIPVNERKGLTFAKGLRSILRHDPDRILVGEIRDAETAEIAVQSALTGHQVFTTVHANSIFDVTGRFRHFGLDMFGFMSSLNGVVVQRLLRRVCTHCAGRRPATSAETAWFNALGLVATDLPSAQTCGHCQHSGYRSRGVIAEVHSIDDGLRDLVIDRAPVSALKRHVQQLGVPTLALQGARQVVQGLTTLEEVRRVVGWI